MMSDSSNSGPSRVDLAGRQLGDFLLLRKLGQGAMAEVYLAEQSSLKRQVAIKVLKSERAEDQTYIKRFQREAQAAAALVHANVVQVYEVGQVDGIHFIVQEYVNGLNLRQWIAKNGPLEPSVAIAVMRQTAAALAMAAEHGIVHRDIKPENILLTRNGEVKVADFGLARLVVEGDAVELTQAGVTMGTPLYMSPEQVEGKKLDPRSDIYSLGVTCYHMLAGEPPFSGNTSLSVAIQHLKKAPKPLGSHRKNLPPELCRVVHKMLEKDPRNRYESPLTLLKDLKQIPIATPDVTSELATSTSRLQAAMDIDAARRPKPLGHLLWAVVLLIAFVLGGELAIMTLGEPSLLADAKETPTKVAKRETGLRQWYYASQADTPEAWRSVIDYFPEERNLAGRAKQQLARIYIDKREDDRAMPILNELAASSDREELRAFGVAGKAVLFAFQGRTQESCEALRVLWPIRDSLRDKQMRRMLRYAVNRDADSLGRPVVRQWQQWLSRRAKGGG